MIDKWSVLSAMKLMYAPGVENCELIGLCASAAQEISSRLKEGADCADMRLINAAAALANLRLFTRESLGDDGIAAFKAGDVSITRNAQASVLRSREEYENALAPALPLLRDDGFVFAGVDV